jgi:hypothetical protein
VEGAKAAVQAVVLVVMVVVVMVLVVLVTLVVLVVMPVVPARAAARASVTAHRKGSRSSRTHSSLRTRTSTMPQMLRTFVRHTSMGSCLMLETSLTGGGGLIARRSSRKGSDLRMARVHWEPPVEAPSAQAPRCRPSPYLHYQARHPPHP